MNIREIEAKSILTKSPVHHGYTANPYAGCEHCCVYCYARYLKDWTGHENEQWGEYLDVKHWKPLSDKQKAKLKGAEIFISSATDPYQDAELQYGRTRDLLEQLLGAEANVLVVTKSKNVLRDWDLLKELDATVGLSINTLDENFKYHMDRGSSIAERFSTLKELKSHGVRTVCFVSPIFPGVTDVPGIIEHATGVCDAVWIEHLVLNGDYKGPVLYYIRTHYPEYYEYYDRIFNKGELDLWWQFDDYIERWCKENKYEYAYSKFPKEHRDRPTVSNFRGHKGR